MRVMNRMSPQFTTPIFPCRNIPKHKILIIVDDKNDQISKQRFCLHVLPNRKVKYLRRFFSWEQFWNAKIMNSKKRDGKLWTYTYPSNTREQLDYVLMNKKWMNSTLKYEAYFYFYMSSDHRIGSAKIRLSLRKNKKRTIKSTSSNWSSFTNISNKYMVN